MRPVAYRCKEGIHLQHFLGQIGHGGGEYFRGGTIQEGYGIGSILSGLVKQAIPLVTKIGKPILKKGAKELIHTGSNILSDVVIHKKKPRASIKKRGKEAVTEALKRAFKGQTGRGRKRTKRQPSVCTKVKKRRLKRDIFGLDNVID